CPDFIGTLCPSLGSTLCHVFPCIAVKPGLCPARAPEGSEDPCFFRCLKDGDCPGNGKCCLISCGRTCLSPMQVKPGACPAVLRGSLGPCVEGCHSDSDCSKAEKCCSTGCGHVCKPPSREPASPTNWTFNSPVSCTARSHQDHFLIRRSGRKPGIWKPHSSPGSPRG
uniref:WAP domain-containing protein n=1 Tax=Gopherus evgoodei TaxID=1825980 RepID=A0A8C4W1E6_9SAUR